MNYIAVSSTFDFGLKNEIYLMVLYFVADEVLIYFLTTHLIAIIYLLHVGALLYSSLLFTSVQCHIFTKTEHSHIFIDCIHLIQYICDGRHVSDHQT